MNGCLVVLWISGYGHHIMSWGRAQRREIIHRDRYYARFQPRELKPCILETTDLKEACGLDAQRICYGESLLYRGMDGIWVRWRCIEKARKVLDHDAT